MAYNNDLFVSGGPVQPVQQRLGHDLKLMHCACFDDSRRGEMATPSRRHKSVPPAEAAGMATPVDGRPHPQQWRWPSMSSKGPDTLPLKDVVADAYGLLIGDMFARPQSAGAGAIVRFSTSSEVGTPKWIASAEAGIDFRAKFPFFSKLVKRMCSTVVSQVAS